MSFEALNLHRGTMPWADAVSSEYLYVLRQRIERNPVPPGRHCNCGALLSRYNDGLSCGPCRYALRNPHIPAHTQPYWRCWERGCGRIRCRNAWQTKQLRQSKRAGTLPASGRYPGSNWDGEA